MSTTENEVRVATEVKVTTDQLLFEQSENRDMVEEFICKICQVHVVGCKPQLTRCAHLFCGDCIAQWFASHRSNTTWAQRAKSGGSVPCPVCKESLHKEKDLNVVSSDGNAGSAALWRFLSATRIMCANSPSCRPDGQCNWIGDYGSYQEHIQNCANVPLSDFAVLKGCSACEEQSYDLGPELAHVEEQKENLIENELESTAAPATTDDYGCSAEIDEGSAKTWEFSVNVEDEHSFSDDGKMRQRIAMALKAVGLESDKEDDLEMTAIAACPDGTRIAMDDLVAACHDGPAASMFPLCLIFTVTMKVKRETRPIENELQSTVAPGISGDNGCSEEVDEDSQADSVASAILPENPFLTSLNAVSIELKAKEDSSSFEAVNDDTSSTGLSDYRDRGDSGSSSDTGYLDNESALQDQSELRQQNVSSLTHAHRGDDKASQKARAREVGQWQATLKAQAAQYEAAAQYQAAAQWQWAHMAHVQAMRMAQWQQAYIHSHSGMAAHAAHAAAQQAAHAAWAAQSMQKTRSS